MNKTHSERFYCHNIYFISNHQNLVIKSERFSGIDGHIALWRELSTYNARRHGTLSPLHAHGTTHIWAFRYTNNNAAAQCPVHSISTSIIEHYDDDINLNKQLNSNGMIPMNVVMDRGSRTSRPYARDYLAPGSVHSIESAAIENWCHFPPQSSSMIWLRSPYQSLPRVVGVFSEIYINIIVAVALTTQEWRGIRSHYFFILCIAYIIYKIKISMTEQSNYLSHLV